MIVPSTLRMDPALCCICDVDNAEPIAVGEDFEYRTSPDSFLAVQCRTCGLIYLDPRPAESELDVIYPPTYHAFAFDAERFGFVDRVRRLLEGRRLRTWFGSLDRSARVVDVGCGDGFHLDVLRSIGYRNIHGIDISTRAVERAKGRGFDVHCARAEDDSLEARSVDAALVIQTIEHVGAPVDLLAAVRRMLRPGGRAYIVTDNTGSYDRRIFGGRHWGGYHFPRHYTLFDRKTLALAAERAGLRVVSIRTIASPVNWTYSVRNLLDDYGAPRWLVNFFTLQSAPALAIFTLLDGALTLAGKGALLHAVLERP